MLLLQNEIRWPFADHSPCAICSAVSRKFLQWWELCWVWRVFWTDFYRQDYYQVLKCDKRPRLFIVWLGCFQNDNSKSVRRKTLNCRVRNSLKWRPNVWIRFLQSLCWEIILQNHSNCNLIALSTIFFLFTTKLRLKIRNQ